MPGVIQQKTSPVSYRVKLTNGKTRRRHLDQVCKRTIEVPQDSYCEPDIPDIVIPSSEIALPSPTNTESSNPSPTSDSTTTESSTNSEPASPDPISTNTDAAVVNPTFEKSYPKCNRAPVVRFEPIFLSLLFSGCITSCLLSCAKLHAFLHSCEVYL